MSKRYYYGGQAVMEGVMMRGQRQMAVAIRQPDGRIALHSAPLDSWVYRSPVRNWPFVRGVFVLWDALLLGMRALTLSANVAFIEEEAGRARAGRRRTHRDAISRRTGGDRRADALGDGRPLAPLRHGALLRPAVADHPFPRPLDRLVDRQQSDRGVDTPRYPARLPGADRADARYSPGVRLSRCGAQDDQCLRSGRAARRRLGAAAEYPAHPLRHRLSADRRPLLDRRLRLPRSPAARRYGSSRGSSWSRRSRRSPTSSSGSAPPTMAIGSCGCSSRRASRCNASPPASPKMGWSRRRSSPSSASWSRMR